MARPGRGCREGAAADPGGVARSAGPGRRAEAGWPEGLGRLRGVCSPGRRRDVFEEAVALPLRGRFVGPEVPADSSCAVPGLARLWEQGVRQGRLDTVASVSLLGGFLSAQGSAACSLGAQPVPGRVLYRPGAKRVAGTWLVERVLKNRNHVTVEAAMKTIESLK